MRSFSLLLVPLLFLAAVDCSSRDPDGSIGSVTTSPITADAYRSAYDRLEQRLYVLLEQLQEDGSQDLLLVEVRELVSVAEEFYLLSEYSTAMEMLRQAVDLLEGRQRGEETRL
jgi:hypothetical protein